MMKRQSKHQEDFVELRKKGTKVEMEESVILWNIGGMDAHSVGVYQKYHLTGVQNAWHYLWLINKDFIQTSPIFRKY